MGTTIGHRRKLSEHLRRVVKLVLTGSLEETRQPPQWQFTYSFLYKEQKLNISLILAQCLYYYYLLFYINF